MADELLLSILAAGQSRRLGQPKQLVRVNGESLLRRQCRVAIESGVGPVAVICGCQVHACIAEISDLPVAIRHNEEWREGIASSIRAATRATIERDAAALLILHVDQFRITADDLRTLHSTWAAAGISIVCRSQHANYVGPPVIVPSRHFSDLLRLQGDDGARSLWANLDANLRRDVLLANAVDDLDVPADLPDS